jgi:drug/metabolite transporter (DMT)-like permease
VPVFSPFSLFFKEAFTGRKIAGLGLILLGVALVGLGEAAR